MNKLPTRQNILAFDGGPSPMVSIRILQRMEKRFPGFLDNVDLFTGTSHGGILSLKLASLLAQGDSACCAIEKCIEFDNEFLKLFKLNPARLRRMLLGRQAMNDSQEFIRFLEKHFEPSGGKPLRMKDLVNSSKERKQHVSVSAFDLNAGKPYLNDSALVTANSFSCRSSNTTVLSAALACSSFPVFMPVFQPDDAPDSIVDGGFGANSGAMPGLSEALRHMHACDPHVPVGKFLPRITLLSMGAVSKTQPLWIPLFDELFQLAEKLHLTGKETKVNGGGRLRSYGWWFLLYHNVTVLLGLLENTQALDRRYADDLLDWTRYYRSAPELEMLSLFWLMMTNPEAAFLKADELAEKYWQKQMDEYECWLKHPELHSSSVFRGEDQLACWIHKHWMAPPPASAVSTTPPSTSLSRDPHGPELRSMSLDPRKRLSTFDASAQPELPQRRLAELGSCHFIKDAQNILIVGPSGTGKTHLAQALGNEAVSRGHQVLYMPVARMLEQLEAARAAGSYDQKLAELAGVELLILEDFGLKPMKDSGPGDFYDVLSERAGTRALLLTSSIPPAEWAGRFGDPRLADAILTRLRQRSDEIVLTGEHLTRGGEPQEAAAQGRQ